jgi:hypothetical protein
MTRLVEAGVLRTVQFVHLSIKYLRRLSIATKTDVSSHMLAPRFQTAKKPSLNFCKLFAKKFVLPLRLREETPISYMGKTLKLFRETFKFSKPDL